MKPPCGERRSGVEKCDQQLDLVSDLRIAAQLICARQRQQNERVVVGIAQRVEDIAVRIEQMHEARPAIGAPGFRQEIFEALDRELAALRIPTDFSGLGEAIDLPRLNPDSPGSQLIRPPLQIEPLHKSAPGLIPTFPRTIAAANARSSGF